MNRYSHTLREQEAEALAVLPDLSGLVSQSLAATGTEGKQSVLASGLAFSSGRKCTLVASNGLTSGDALQCTDLEKIRGFRVFSGFRECLHLWWGPWSSKPVAGLNKARSGFDSQTLPYVFM